MSASERGTRAEKDFQSRFAYQSRNQGIPEAIKSIDRQNASVDATKKQDRDNAQMGMISNRLLLSGFRPVSPKSRRIYHGNGEVTEQWFFHSIKIAEDARFPMDQVLFWDMFKNGWKWRREYYILRFKATLWWACQKQNYKIWRGKAQIA